MMMWAANHDIRPSIWWIVRARYKVFSILMSIISFCPEVTKKHCLQVAQLLSFHATLTSLPCAAQRVSAQGLARENCQARIVGIQIQNGLLTYQSHSRGNGTCVYVFHTALRNYMVVHCTELKRITKQVSFQEDISGLLLCNGNNLLHRNTYKNLNLGTFELLRSRIPTTQIIFIMYFTCLLYKVLHTFTLLIYKLIL